jgi:hypothetical protein
VETTADPSTSLRFGRDDKGKDGASGVRAVEQRPFSPGRNTSVVVGKRQKDRPLMGLRPVFLNPRTLVRTWGTRTELMAVEESTTRKVFGVGASGWCGLPGYLADCLLIQDLAGYDQALDFAGSFAYRAELYVAVELLYWVILDETVASVQLDCLVADLHRDLAGHQLGHR